MTEEEQPSIAAENGLEKGSVDLGKFDSDGEFYIFSTNARRTVASFSLLPSVVGFAYRRTAECASYRARVERHLHEYIVTILACICRLRIDMCIIFIRFVFYLRVLSSALRTNFIDYVLSRYDVVVFY